jgi:hypothetical protein
LDLGPVTEYLIPDAWWYIYQENNGESSPDPRVLLSMKGFISSIFAAFAFVALGFSLEESATSNLRTEVRAVPTFHKLSSKQNPTQTCGDISELAPFYQVYIPSITAHIYTIYDFNIT